MGFFSAVKRMFGGQPKPKAAPPEPENLVPEVASDTAPETVAEVAPEVAAEIAAEPAADVPPLESSPEGTADSAAEVDAAPQVTTEEPEQATDGEEAIVQEADSIPQDVPAATIEETDVTAPAAPVTPDMDSPAEPADVAQDVSCAVSPEPEGTAEQPDVQASEQPDDQPDELADALAEAQSEDVVAEPMPESEQEETAPPVTSVQSPASAEEAALLLRLREAEPRLSVWLGIVLEGVEQAGDLLWQRLAFLLHSLEAPPAEVDAFVADFRDWLTRMEYVYVEEFRSELQYRLALALELEDEEDERSRLFLKISEGLSRTREQLSRGLDALFAGHGELDESFWEELEELFIMADLGYEPALELVERLRERARKAGAQRADEVRGLLMAELEEIFRMPPRIVAVNRPEVVLFIGVNGVGKTTTIAKLAHRARMQGKKVMIAAADTFRAAAIEQLQVWAERVGALFHARTAGSDPAAVAYEAVERAVRENVDLLLVDTAGRLQTKVNLMEELGKIRQVLGKKHPGAPHRSILVLDATTGQNALSQTKLFKEAAGVDELILTKLDGTAKGGVAIAVAMQHSLPITYVGLGEKMEDLRPFNGEDYARALLGQTAAGNTGARA